MTYFQNIHSFAELKKQYRVLALANHPDKGGSTEAMQRINTEFARLHAIWKDDTSVSDSASGYENDYAEATAQEYADYVYNEYRWMGSNYKGQRAPEVVELLRQWLKETYPRYKFSVRRTNYDSIHIALMQADFEAFTKESGVKTYADLNHFYIDEETQLTERAREVMKNVCSFVQSYNFDNSDPMTDYFCKNFYLYLSIGTYKKPYQTVLPKLRCRDGDEQPVFRHPEGPAHKAIRQALGGARFGFYDSEEQTAEWCSERIRSVRTARQVSGPRIIRVPRRHRSVSTSSRQQGFAVGLPVTIAVISNFWAIQRRREKSLNKKGKNTLLPIGNGRKHNKPRTIKNKHHE